MVLRSMMIGQQGGAPHIVPDENGHKDCYRIPAAEISKTEVKRLLTAGSEVPGVELVQDYSCSLR